MLTGRFIFELRTIQLSQVLMFECLKRYVSDRTRSPEFPRGPCGPGNPGIPGGPVSPGRPSDPVGPWNDSPTYVPIPGYNKFHLY